MDISLATLLRRLGPRLLRGRPTPERVIDWDAVAPFGDDLTTGPSTVRLRRSDDDLHRLQPSDFADLLEDLDRTERQSLLHRLDRETAADALEEMDPDELHALLREADPIRAAELLASMEPDEAVDALRDLSDTERTDILTRMPDTDPHRLERTVGLPRTQRRRLHDLRPSPGPTRSHRRGSRADRRRVPAAPRRDRRRPHPRRGRHPAG